MGTKATMRDHIGSKKIILKALLRVLLSLANSKAICKKVVATS